MNLEQKVKKTIIYVPLPEINEQVEKGKQFIIVEDVPMSSIPFGYTLIDMKYKSSSFKALVPQNLLFYLANPGEGNIDDALDQISEFYNNAKDYEDDFIENGNTSVQQASWSTLAKKTYETYLINKLVTHKNGAFDDDGEPIPDFDKTFLDKYGFTNSEVDSRAKAIAALVLNKDVKDIEAQNIAHILEHVTETKQLSREEFKEITCWAGSHYEIKPKYRNEGYDIEKRHDRGHMSGMKKISESFFNGSIEKLEDEALSFMSVDAKKDEHIKGVFREYVNLKYISKENPCAQLTIIPKGDYK